MGIFDVFKRASDAAVQAVTNPISTAKQIVSLPVALVNRIVDTANSLDEMPRDIKDAIVDYGSYQITSIVIFREPVNAAVRAAARVVTGGSLTIKIRHVFEVFELATPNGPFYLRVEKDEIVKYSKIDKRELASLKQSRENQTVVLTTPLTFKQYFDNYVQHTNPKMLWLYDPVTANCQVFVYLGLLASNIPVSKELEDFIVQQGVRAQVSGMSQDIMKGITTMANFGKRFIGADGDMVEYDDDDDSVGQGSFADLLNEHAELVCLWVQEQRRVERLKQRLKQNEKKMVRYREEDDDF